jgi:hypothetical protein
MDPFTEVAWTASSSSCANSRKFYQRAPRIRLIATNGYIKLDMHADTLTQIYKTLTIHIGASSPVSLNISYIDIKNVRRKPN